MSEKSVNRSRADLPTVTHNLQSLARIASRVEKEFIYQNTRLANALKECEECDKLATLPKI